MAPQETPQHYSLVWSSLLWGHCSFLLGHGVHKILFVPSKRGVSIHPPPPSYGNPTAKSCRPSKSDPLGIPSPYASSPSWKAWHGSSEPSVEWENSFGAMVLQFLGCPSSGYGVWFYHDCTPPTMLLQLLLFLSTWGIFFFFFFFGGFQYSPVNGCSAASCDLGDLTGGDKHMSTIYSTILNQSPQNNMRLAQK